MVQLRSNGKYFQENEDDREAGDGIFRIAGGFGRRHALGSVKDGFAKLLYGLAAETREQHERGCLLLSANLQRDTKDAVVRDLLRGNQATVEEIFAKALKRAQKQRELSNKEDSAALARFFVVTIQGMRAMARLKSDRKALEQVAQVALAIFTGSKGEPV